MSKSARFVLVLAMVSAMAACAKKEEAVAVKAPEKRGADYVAIFVRQLGGSILAPDTTRAGTTVTVRFPLHVVPPTSVEGLAA